MATPNDVAKFNKSNPPENTPENTPTPEPEPKQDDNTPMIVHRQNYIDGEGVQQTKEHGPMPVSEWPAYEKAHNL